MLPCCGLTLRWIWHSILPLACVATLRKKSGSKINMQNAELVALIADSLICACPLFSRLHCSQNVSENRLRQLSAL